MNKRIEIIDGRAVIHTTNGVDTTTAPVYVRELRTYTPLPNGFNLELADHIWAIITRHPQLWMQDTWRTVWKAPAATGIDDAWEKRVADVLEQGRAITGEEQAPKCGTSMCVAGWGVELTGGDWVRDASTLDSAYTSGTESVVVTRKVWEQMEQDLSGAVDYQRLENFDPRALAGRGFDERTHVAVSAASYGTWVLGLKSDWLEMFAGTNSLPRIRACIDVYATYVKGGVESHFDALERRNELTDAYADEYAELGHDAKAFGAAHTTVTESVG